MVNAVQRISLHPLVFTYAYSGPTGLTKGKTRGDWIERKLSPWPQSPLVFTLVFKNVLHWSLFFLKAGKVFLASSHGTTLCKTGHRSESTLTCFEHFLYFIQIVWNWGSTSSAEQPNGARGRCENRNITGWLNGFNCGLRSVHPISTDILNYAILSTLKDSRTGLVLCLYFLKWNSILKQEIYSSQRAQFRCVLLAPTTLLSDRHQQPMRLKMLKSAAKFRIFPFHLLIPVLVKEKWL